MPLCPAAPAAVLLDPEGFQIELVIENRQCVRRFDLEEPPASLDQATAVVHEDSQASKGTSRWTRRASLTSLEA
jgi:hypothetical protein